jgi:hypothetical protein
MWSRAEIDGQIAEIDKEIRNAEQRLSAMQQAFSTCPLKEQMNLLLLMDATRQVIRALKQHRAQLLEEAARLDE